MMAPDNDPEQLLDAFRAAALSVTKLYKTSASAQTKARADGYQECLDDLLSFLDREDIGEGATRRLRRWAAERRAGSGDAMVQDKESEDEVEKESDAEKSHDRAEALPASDGATGIASAPVSVVPTQEHFTFSSGMPYPDAPNLATLNLSDSTHPPTPTQTQTPTQTHPPRPRRVVGRQSSRTGASLGRGAGQKRRLNFAEIFDLGSLGNGKDMFGGGKRTRHI